MSLYIAVILLMLIFLTITRKGPRWIMAVEMGLDGSVATLLALLTLEGHMDFFRDVIALMFFLFGVVCMSVAFSVAAAMAARQPQETRLKVEVMPPPEAPPVAQPPAPPNVITNEYHLHVHGDVQRRESTGAIRVLR